MHLAWSVACVLLLAGCTDDPDSKGDDDGASPGGQETEAPSPLVHWQDAYLLDFTMAAPGQQPQQGENCVGGEFEGVASIWVNATWTPDIPLRMVVATDFGGTIVVDESGTGSVSVDVGDRVAGDEHVTFALLAPEQGTAPTVEATLALDVRAATAPSPGTAACSF